MKRKGFWFKHPIGRKGKVFSLAVDAAPKPKDFRVPQSAENEERDPREPEYALIASVLHRALLDLLAPPESAISKSAYKWCLSRSKSKDFSFIYCCEALNIDAEMLRKKVIALKAFMENSESPSNVVDIELFFFRLRSHSKKTI